MIYDSYLQADQIVGEVMKIIDDKTLLIVNSDHGFHGFRRAVNLNTWLVNNKYMKFIGQHEDRNLDDLFGQGQFWQNVDWSQTMAYALGLGQIYLNMDGRESQGVVAEGTEKEKLIKALQDGLTGLRDPDYGDPDQPVILGVYEGDKIYSGPKETMDLRPDLVVGFNDGYRTSWQTALGGVPKDVFQDNNRKWSGDHCSFDPNITHGVMFSSLPITKKDLPEIIDVVPSALKHLNITPDDEMDGENVL
jgi:predicted AlkP superfamily phosphohydrolase/phosphomutase